MKKAPFVLAAALAAGISGTAAAQVCNGFPTSPGQYSVAAVGNFPKNVDEFGVEASYHFSGPLAVNGGILHDADQNSDDTLDRLRIGASYDLAPLNVGMTHPLSVCPVASLDYADKDDVARMVIPVGVGFGLTLPMGADPSGQIMPYVVPALVIDRLSNPVASVTDTNFGLRGGDPVAFPRR